MKPRLRKPWRAPDRDGSAQLGRPGAVHSWRINAPKAVIPSSPHETEENALAWRGRGATNDDFR